MKLQSQTLLILLLVIFIPNVFSESKSKEDKMDATVKILMMGDVMTGRGIDQILPFHNKSNIFEPYMKDAKGYVQLASQKNGPISMPIGMDYIWGFALTTIKEQKPNVIILNLETSITNSDDYMLSKGIHYRMHPKNIDVLKEIKVDVCLLANNHVLDWGEKGFQDTLDTLSLADIKYAGAGENIAKSTQPAIIDINPINRILIFSLGVRSSGIPTSWMAGENKPGVNLVRLDKNEIDLLKDMTSKLKTQNDIVLVSLHWGGNWGHTIPTEHKDFAHKLIDDANVDIIFGHSSHHPMGIEIYHGKLIIYGAGDIINDYEGISGRENALYRDDLGLIYIAEVKIKSGHIKRLVMVPTIIQKMRINKPDKSDVDWRFRVLSGESRKLGTQIVRSEDDNFLILED